MPKRKTSSKSQDNKGIKKSKPSSSLMLSSNMSSFPGPDLPIGAKSSVNSRKIHAAIVGNRLLYGRAKPQMTRKLVIKSAKGDSEGGSGGADIGSGVSRAGSTVTSATTSSATSSAEKYYSDTMQKLKTTLIAILSPGLVDGNQCESTPYSNNISQEELYRGVENLCRYNKSSQLAELCLSTIGIYANMLPTVLKRYTDGGIISTSSSSTTAEPSSYYPFLKSLNDLWKSWSLKITLVRNIFFYLDRSYLLPPQNKLKPIWDTGVVHFSNLILRDSTFNYLLYKGVSEIVNSFRSSKQNQIEIIESISKMLVDFKSDHPQLEDCIIQSAKDFCNEVTFDSKNIELFITTVLSQIDIEKNLAFKLNFSDDFTAKMIINIKELLVKSRYNEVFKNIGILIDGSLTKPFQEIYTISQELSIRLELLSSFKDFIIMTGIKILKENSNKKIGGSDFINEILVFYNKCKLIVDQSTFAPVPNTSSVIIQSPIRLTTPSLPTSDEDFENTFRTSFTEFLNKDHSDLVAEKLAKYADELLRSGLKTCTEQEFDSKLDELILIFRCLQGKDTFGAFYKRDFAKRLLQAKSSGIDFEKLMISKFKKVCGPAFTSHFESMIKDMELSKTYAEEFRKISPKPIAFTANILTQGQWPSFPDMQFNLPPSLIQYEKQFENYYLPGKDGRKLMWQRGLGHCIMKATFPSGIKELSINLLQAAILLQFDEDDKKLSYNEVKSLIKIEDDGNLKRALQSLACGKAKVLSKEPFSKDINPTDIFSINLNFKDKAYRIKLTQITSSASSSVSSTNESSSSKESKKIHEEVKRERQMEIQAAIVRIMKTRKSLKHLELVQQTINLIKDRGVPDILDIETNINRLLERELLARDTTDNESYKYI